MHILLVTHYFEPDSGAAAVRLSRLAHLLQQRGHEITVLTTLPHYPQGEITSDYHRTFSRVEDHNGIRLIRAWLWATPNRKISRRFISQLSFMFSSSLRGLPISRPDVMLIEAQPIFTGLAGRWLSFVKRVPYVLNVSDLWPDHLLSVGALTETHPVYRIARKLVDSTYRRANGIVAMSPAWAEKIEQCIGETEKIKVIYNGVDLERFRPGLDAKSFRQRYAPNAKKLVTFIGTFATQYDLETMLDVAGQMAERTDLTFLFVGAGTQGEILRQQLDERKLPNVRVIDWIEHQDILIAWSSSDVTYWAMRDEPLYLGTIPAKLYEALACGVPIAAATGGEGAAMIERSGGGIAVSPGDVEALVQGIQHLLDDRALRLHFSQSGRAYAEANFNPEVVALAYEQILLKAIEL